MEFGDFSLDGKWINERFLAYKKHPIIHRAKMVSDDIYEFIETKNIMGKEIPNAKGIFKKIKTFINAKSPLELYIKFYKDMGISDMFFPKGNKILEWNDVYPFMYFKIFFYGTEEYNSIKHLVVDEMQDYTPIEYAVLNKIFKCRKTILGDFGQFINPNKLNTLRDLKGIYINADFVEMNKSYRSTYEIIEFAKRIRSVNSIEPIERHGDEPEIISCKNHGEEIRIVKKIIDEFKKSDRSTLGIILKTDESARKLYSEIEYYSEMNLLIESSYNFSEGVSIMSVENG